MSLSSQGPQKPLLQILLEVVLVAVGVFLALWANSWHEEREHRALAESTLLNFAEEMRTNQQALQKNRQYHETLARELREFVSSTEPPTEARLDKTVHFTGIHPVTFERTAWDLALATQALSYLKPDLAFDISKVYTQQSAFQKLEDSFLASAYTPASFAGENPKPFALAMQVYLGDVNIQEPLLLQRYDKVIPQIERVLPPPTAPGQSQ